MDAITWRRPGNIVRTYARHQPQNRLQLQNWLTPPIRQQHIFSSSSSSSMLSSSTDQQDSADPDFQPASKRLRKKSVADPCTAAASRNVVNLKMGKKALKVKKKTRSVSQPRNRRAAKACAVSEEPIIGNKQMEDLHEEGKENSIPGTKRSFIHVTPPNKFITNRRKAAVLANRFQSSSGRRIQSVFTEMRLVPLNVSNLGKSGRKTNITNTPREARLVPIDVCLPPVSQKRCRNSSRKVRLKLCSSGSSAGFHVSCKKPQTRRQAQNVSSSFTCSFNSGKMTSPLRRPMHKPPLCSTPTITADFRNCRAEQSVEVSFDTEAGALHGELHSFGPEADVSSHRSGHPLQCHSASPGRSHAVNPNSVSCSMYYDSKSVICISHCTPSESCSRPSAQHNVQSKCIVCISPELFSPESCSDVQNRMEPVVHLDHSSLRVFQRTSSFQPVVSLNSGTVSRYFLTSKEPPPTKEMEDLSSLDSPVHDSKSLDAEKTEVEIQEMSCGRTLSKSEDEKSATNPSDSVMNSASVPSNQIPDKGGCSTVAPESNTGIGTGRKVCISGFSSKRWGNRTRTADATTKSSKRDFYPSFRNQNSNVSLLENGIVKRKQTDEVAMYLGFGDNLEDLESMVPAELLDSSFLNSSAVLNLSSNSSLFWDNRHYARLRAALSLHKRKKVEVEAQSEVQGAEGTNLFAPSTPYSHLKPLGILKTPIGQRLAMEHRAGRSSMNLLSPLANTSFCGDLITDAEKVYEECMQDGPISFTRCISPKKMQQCVKIGEGVFGEVFRTVHDGDHVALKIIPIEGSQKINGEAQKSFGEILPEIIISKELSLLCEEGDNVTVGFIKLHSVHCVRGAYPKHLLQAWDKYEQAKGSDNDRPDLFGEGQLFIILEFEFGGSDLENMKYELSSVNSAKSILHQVTAALAVAEEALCFEHRDLHWGNILVKKTNLKKIEYTLNGSTSQMPSHNVEANIIDYTLSRLEKDGLTVFCDISADEELFQGEGDYQFDMYRLMKEENGNTWSGYHPHSNVLWLHYVADKLIKEMQYKRKPTTPALKSTRKKLLDFYKEVLKYRSAREVLHHSSLFK
ncbi:serine/threonine-protein kinase haspin isoform X2 [Ambystoma mexicanum]|uniref:serine/threonine-protein kinase haspin isoform X2 n=1 Tax=Ambystoma mexicanum TaxID=8296 RepID=UPI0037E798C2